MTADPIPCNRCKAGCVVVCATCKGGGAEAGELGPIVCRTCRGEKQVVCSACHGTGLRVRVIVKTCRACGTSFDAAAWAALEYKGVQNFDDLEPLELRNCRCGSTIALPAERREVA